MGAKKTLRKMNEKAAEEDPLSNLGYGIVAYVNILYVMIWVFILFTILVMPTMMGYKAGIALEGEEHVGYADGMIGNLGYSGVECHNIPVSLGNIAITCQYGAVGEILDYGVNNPDSGSPVDACTTNDDNKSCKPDNKEISESLNGAIG